MAFARNRNENERQLLRNFSETLAVFEAKNALFIGKKQSFLSGKAVLSIGKSSPFYRGKHPFERLLSMESEAIVSQMSVSKFATCTLKALPLRHETNSKSTIVNL